MLNWIPEPGSGPQGVSRSWKGASGTLAFLQFLKFSRICSASSTQFIDLLGSHQAGAGLTGELPWPQTKCNPRQDGFQTKGPLSQNESKKPQLLGLPPRDQLWTLTVYSEVALHSASVCIFYSSFPKSFSRASDYIFRLLSLHRN